MHTIINKTVLHQAEVVLAETSKFNSLEIPAIKVTMKLHEIVSVSKGAIHYRDISCVCRLRDVILNCPCYEPKTFQFDVQTKGTDIGQLTCTPD